MSKPNILFVLADDLGWGDLGVYGQTEFTTPNLDKLSNKGVRFTQAYANSAVCSATRFALITGRYQYRLRGGLEEPLVRVANGLGLPEEHPTLPSQLKEAGYETALIGKWHLGKPPQYSPLKSGYDHFFGNHSGAVDYFTHRDPSNQPDLWDGDVPVERTGYYTELLGDSAVQYVKDRKDSEKPWFLSLHFTAPHWPWEGPEDEAVSKEIKQLWHTDGGSIQKYGEIVHALDAAVGRVVDALEATGQLENTIVVFTSDNGGERFSKNWPFIGQKTELLEGGLRVPTIFTWPAQIKPQVSEQVTITADWLPTLLAAAGATPNAEYPPDGVDILPVLKGGKAQFDRTLYWRYKANKQRALRSGNLKYVKIQNNEYLFNVYDDWRERANLKDKQPEDFAKLKATWDEYDAKFIPLTDDVFTHGVSSLIYADRYAPDADNQLPKIPK